MKINYLFNWESSPVVRIDSKRSDDGQPFGSNPSLPPPSSFPDLYQLSCACTDPFHDVVPHASTGVRDRLQGLFLPRD